MFKKLKPEFWAALVAALLTSLAIQAFAQEAELPPQPHYTPEQAEEVRQYLVQALTEGKAGMDDIIDKIQDGTIAKYDKNTLSTGLYLETQVLDEANKVRHTVVARVFPYTPADRAGIKPGDRLFKIGDEELDNETGKAVRLYMANYGKEVPVTILRQDDTRLEVTLALEPVPCFADILRTFRKSVWLHRFTDRRNLGESLRLNLVAKEGKATDLEVKATILRLQILSGMISQDIVEMEAELDPGQHPACQPRN